MLETTSNKLQMFGILLCLLVIALCGVVTTQEALPYQYTPPRQYAFTNDRRRLPSYNGFSASSLPGNSDLIRFPDDDSMSPVSLVRSVNDQNIFNERHKKDNRNDDESHHQQSNEVSFVPMNVTNDLNTYEDFFNFLDEESRGQVQMISPRFGGEEVERSRGARPVPANCIPEMTTIPLKLSDGSDIKDPTIVVFPSCTRVKRCGGCCNNNLVSCQPIETNNIVYEVFKSQYQGGGKMKFLNKELIEVEEHTKCKCECRKKESDCTKFQRYNKAQCLCACINIEDKNKCLRESSEGKMWDPDSCTCRCREVKDDCSTGTYFDSNTCSCQETPGHRHTQQVSDRRRLIVKPQIYVPVTPETYDDSGT